MSSLGKIAAKNWDAVRNADVHVMLEVGDQYFWSKTIFYILPVEIVLEKWTGITDIAKIQTQSKKTVSRAPT